MEAISLEKFLNSESLLADYRLAVESRIASFAARKDVFSGKAKFAVTGDGKEIPQLALAKFFSRGDWRSGYYRDQTMMVALGELTWQQYFAQLYAHASADQEPHTAGRSMNAHYGNKLVDAEGTWLDQTTMHNSVVDVSSTAMQMPRALGLAYASKLYKHNKNLKSDKFSKQGREVCFATIGDASTSQGMFFEAINAAGVLQVPMICSVWDDGYGISVPIDYQTTKGSISEALAGFERTDKPGFEIIKVIGWDYPAVLEAYQRATLLARNEHIPVLIHVVELTQPQGHSTSGSHERYKSEDRLSYEQSIDCNLKFRNWLIENSFASESQLNAIDHEAEAAIKKAKNDAWDALRAEFRAESSMAILVVKKAMHATKYSAEIAEALKGFEGIAQPIRKDILTFLKAVRLILRFDTVKIKAEVQAVIGKFESENTERYASWLYSESATSPLNVKGVAPVFNENAPIDGREVINAAFNHLFETHPEVVVLGEDVGKIGDVNQGLAGIQEKYGELRITDTGIRETTILGQGIGLAVRGFRPIVEIQYLDYIYFALAMLTDEVACLSYRSKGNQRLPLIVRTRGHRLEGIWHSGSPMAVLIHALRGMHLLVPRDFVRAAGFYNTLVLGDDPALIIEPLNGYRVKEKLPTNLAELKTQLGKIEILKAGKDLTIVTYGSMCRIVMEAAETLEKLGINAEIIDVQSLLPFDLEHEILSSLKKTNRIVFADEDMPGGATAFMMQQVIEIQGGYKYLDSPAKTITAKDHRPPYGTDGDYFTKPNVETVVEAVYEMFNEVNPDFFPPL